MLFSSFKIRFTFWILVVILYSVEAYMVRKLIEEWNYPMAAYVFMMAILLLAGVFYMDRSS